MKNKSFIAVTGTAALRFHAQGVSVYRPNGPKGGQRVVNAKGTAFMPHPKEVFFVKTIR